MTFQKMAILPSVGICHYTDMRLLIIYYFSFKIKVTKTANMMKIKPLKTGSKAIIGKVVCMKYTPTNGQRSTKY
jgi:hypothetical protein